MPTGNRRLTSTCCDSANEKCQALERYKN